MYAARSIFAKSDVGDDDGERTMRKEGVFSPSTRLRGAKHLKLKGAYYMYLFRNGHQKHER